MKELQKKKGKKLKRFLSVLLAVSIFITGAGLENFAQEVQAAEYTTLYIVDDTPERWLGNDNAVMELVDNTSGHDHYIMKKENSTTWSVRVPATTYNVTFNRLSPDMNTQWNSWSAGGRDGHSTYHAITHEHGYWDGTAAVLECFQEGDVIYLDYYEFADWEKSGALFYANFTDASKTDNNGADIVISDADTSQYDPVLLSEEIEEQVYTYTVTAEDEGATELRFWRGNSSTLWNCSVTLSYSDYKAGNNCVKVQGWNDTGYVCPYVPRRHITQIDSIELNVSGNQKVNRKIDIDLDIQGETDLLLTEETSITITKTDSNGEVIDSAEENYLAYDEAASEWNHRELIFRESGTYHIVAVATDGTDSFQAESTIVVAEDKAPAAGIRLGEDDGEVYLRDETGSANIGIQDISVSEINDEIVQRVYTVYHDSDNNGEYTENEIIETVEGNETQVSLGLNAVGHYLIKLSVKESFTDTIEALLNDDAYLSGETSRELEVTNQAPSSAMSMSKSRIADIIFTVGNADSGVLADYAAATDKVKQKLEELGIEANVSTVSTSALTAQDTFAWTEYDHYNYTDRYLPTLDKHIIYDGNDIKMVGYSYAAMKDFLYVADSDSSRKVFEFDLQRDNTNWHSMEGGGFLFNTVVSEEENYIQGYCILVTQSGLKLVQINKTNLSNFRNGNYNQVQNAGKLLQTFSMTDLYAEHHFKIITDGNILTVYDGDKLLIDEYVLPDDGVEAYGYGPIISHSSHACSQQSYFTFKNIIMQTVTGENLSDVVNSHEWTPGTNHYVINLSETSVPELSDTDRLSEVAAALSSNDAMFFGIGNDTTINQYNSLLNAIDGAGENMKLSEADSVSDESGEGESQEVSVSVADAIDQIVAQITADISGKDYSIEYTLSTDEKVEYSGTYTDPENDPLGEEEWYYVYDASAFGGSEEGIQYFTYSEPITMFTNAGAYTISHRVSDDPTGDNEDLEAYTKWSDTDEYTKLILSQHRPVADITATVTQSPNDAGICLVNVQYDSYDEDHSDDAQKGIRDEKFYYKELGESEWTEGRFPAQVQMGTTYLVKYVVTDIEGTVSRPAVIAVKTNDAREYVEPDDDNPPTVNLVVSENTVEVGGVFYVEASAEDDYGVASFTVKNGDEEIGTIYGRFECTAQTAGEYTITATATDIGGNVTTETQTVTVIDKSDVTPPVIEITSPGNGAISGKTDIVGTIKDNKQLKSYTVTMTKVVTEADEEADAQKQEEETSGGEVQDTAEPVVLASGTEEIIDDVIAVIDTDELGTGVYKIDITAEDMAGHTSSLAILITVSEEQYDKIPPQAQITDISLDSDNAVITVTGTVTDETGIAGYELYLCGENDTENLLIAAGKSQITESVIGTIGTEELENGTYILTLRAWDEEGNLCENTARFAYTKRTEEETGEEEAIDVSEDLVAPVILTELSAAITSEGLKLSLSGTIDDENLTEYTVMTGKADDDGAVVSSRTIASGTASVIDGLIAEYTYTEYEPGDYIVTIIASDAAGNVMTFTYTVTIKENGTIDDGYAGEEDESLNLILSNTTSYTGNTITVYLTYPSGATDVSLTADNAEVVISGRTAQITAAEAGEVTITLSVTIDGEVQSVSQSVRFYDGSDTTYPTGYFLTPEADEEINTITEIMGTADDESGIAYYTLEYRMEGTDEYIQIARGEDSVTDGSLGTLDTTMMENGRYLLRLTVVDNGGNAIRVERAVNVTGNLKVGNMNLGFTDISSNVSGIALSVTRNYSSMNKSSGDFGTGWTMGLQSAKLIESTDITQGYSRIQQGTGLSTAYYMVQTQCHDITVTYGDGTSDRFELTLSPASQMLVPMYEVSVSFTCVTDKNVKLELDGDNRGLIYGNELIFTNFKIGGAHSYILTRKDGTKLYLSTEYGLLKMDDANGNTVSITKNGYKHSSGNSVVFERDEQGRIIRAQELNSSSEVITSITYAYDKHDNLIAVTDNADRTVMFTYDADHNMTGIIDPSGAAVARNIYDDEGRLIATVDAEGNRIEYEHDIEGRTEVVRDKLGNATVYTYDDNGNILKTVDALGNITTSTYDEDNNVLTKTDALGNVTSYEYDESNNLINTIDALGQVTTAAYGSQNEILKITQDNLLSVSLTYDTAGNVTSVTDAQGNVKEYAYESDGSLSSISDSIGTILTMTYDSEGRIATSTDAVGNTVVYSYDSAGNCSSTEFTKQTETGTVTITNLYFYDASGNVIKTVDSLGGEKTLEYDVNGRIVSMTDENGLRTSYSYDSLSNIAAINYSDGTREAFTYDANGNILTSTDRENLTKTYSYDKLGRNTQITLPDGNQVQYEYDAAGNLTAYISATGARTTYDYDALGRNTSVTDDDGNRMSYTYGIASELLSVTDMMGRTTAYEYDNAGNVVRITYPDSAEYTMTYDARSRLTEETDCLGNTTSYTYDDADRLTSVTDALGNTTTYEYDNLGELCRITDALGNTTTYEYDTLGRRISDTDALGQTRTYEYSATGNLIKETSYSGTVTQYSYDECDRLERITVISTGTEGISAGTSVTTYKRDEYGRITDFTDESGTITYTYDELGRVESVTDAEGITLAYTYDTYGRKASVKAVKYSGDAENENAEDSDAEDNNEQAESNSARSGVVYGTTYYEYDKYNRLTRVSDSFGNEMTYAYNADSTLASEQGSNGVTTLYTYDVCGELSSVKSIDALSQTVSEYSYTRNASGEVTGIEESTRNADGTVSVKTTAYTYDSADRLTKESISNDDGSITFEYGYDSVSNRTSQSVSFSGDVSSLIDDTGLKDVEECDITYTYNGCSQLLEEVRVYPDGTTKSIKYAYDTEGNLVSETSEDEEKTYTYNLYGNMISASVTEYTDGGLNPENGTVTRSAKTTSESYGYDAEGIRNSKETSGERNSYVVDRSLTYSHVLVELADSGEVYYYTRGKQLICRTDAGGLPEEENPASEHSTEEENPAGELSDESETTNLESVYYLHDGHGNVRMLTDAAGNITDAYSYNAYGVLLTKEGETENSYLYNAEQQDSTTGLYYLRARYMNPLTATFTQKDSYEGDIYSPVTLNGYLYTNGNPVMYTDPSGNYGMTLTEAVAATAITTIISVAVMQTCYSLMRMIREASTYSVGSDASLLKMEFAAAMQQENGWEIITVPEKIDTLIIHGIPMYVLEPTIETFPAVIQEAWTERFPAYVNDTLSVVLGPQAVERDFWDNIISAETSYGKSIVISEQKMYQLGNHYNKHGRNMGFSSKKEYEQAARDFFEQYGDVAEIYEGTFNSAHGDNVGMRQIILRHGDKQLIISKESGQLIDFYEGTSLSSFIDVERVQ